MQTRGTTSAGGSDQPTAQTASTRISQAAWRKAVIDPVRKLRARAASEGLTEEEAADKYGLLTSAERAEK